MIFFSGAFRKAVITSVCSHSPEYACVQDQEGVEGTVPYNTRWIVHVFEQIHGINYDRTCASEVKSMPFKVLFAIVAYYDLDTETSFHVPIVSNEDIYLSIACFKWRTSSPNVCVAQFFILVANLERCNTEQPKC